MQDRDIVTTGTRCEWLLKSLTSSSAAGTPAGQCLKKHSIACIMY